MQKLVARQYSIFVCDDIKYTVILLPPAVFLFVVTRQNFLNVYKTKNSLFFRISHTKNDVHIIKRGVCRVYFSQNCLAFLSFSRLYKFVSLHLQEAWELVPSYQSPIKERPKFIFSLKKRRFLCMYVCLSLILF